MTKKTLSQIASAEVKALTNSEQIDIKGGLLLYCEEKRRSFLGVTYTSRQWKLANDGSLLLSVKM